MNECIDESMNGREKQGEGGMDEGWMNEERMDE